MNRPCNACVDRVLETTGDWLKDEYEGGVIGTTGHYDHESRTDCPAFVFHWGLELETEFEEEDPDE